MKKISIGLKIMLCFTLVLTIIVIFTYYIIISISYQIIHKGIRDNLIKTVQNNLDEFEYYETLDQVVANDIDRFIYYDNGYLEISANFLYHINGVYTGLYREDTTLIYGENPIAKEVKDLAFSDSTIQKVTVDDTLYYIFDKKIEIEGNKHLWLRGVISEKQGMDQIYAITRLSLIIFPMLILISAIGGYFMVKRMLSPIHKMSITARQIGKEGNFKKRINIGKGKDELHELANSFNEMLARLEETFLKEQQFTSDASHELRTPVSVISAQCQLSLEEKRSVEEYKEDLKVIKRQTQKMSKLINDMLDFTRLEKGAENYEITLIDMTNLVLSICRDMALIKEKGICLTYEVEPNIIFKGNEQLLSRALANLISNAYRYGHKKGNIWINLKHEGESSIKLSVKDNGIGIKKEEQEKIFYRFYQADASHSGEGTGLGLAMVHEIIKFHKGEIYVESQLGKGSTFTIIFQHKEE